MGVASGQIVGQGRFEVLARIGEGGAGVVYEVRDRQSDARLALKTVDTKGPDALVSLKREFRAVQDFAHPNLCRLDELFEENGAWFFTMELVDGTDWLSYATDETRLRATLVQVVEALSALHTKGTVHRDVKPSNVLVSPSGHVKLLDFGIATSARRANDGSEGMVGTLDYMAPEQLLSEEPTPAGDFYAVGVMLHQALTGKLPFFDRAGDSINERLSGEPTPIKNFAPHVSDDLATLCDALLQSHRDARPDAPAILRLLGADPHTSSGEMAVARDEFVGRTSELRALWNAFAEVRDTKATVTLVVEGASGVGKSALVQHFLTELRSRALVLHGRCHEREFVPYKGVDAIVDDLAAHLAEEGEDILRSLSKPALRLLPRLFPVLQRIPFFREVGPPSSTLEGDAHEIRGRIFGAFRELMTRVAERRPLVLAIDDLQWADGDTMALLSDLLAPPSPPAILLVCTRRIADESERTTAPPPVALPGDVRTVLVGGLSGDDASALAEQLSQQTGLGKEELAALAHESAGHPLFLQELVRRRLSGTEASPHLRLDDALWSRVRLLGAMERRVVEAIAVAGVPTSLDVILSATEIARRDLPQVMATLRSAHLVKVSGSSALGRLEPYHDRVREAVVRHLEDHLRQSWHLKLAEALSAAPERDIEQLAIHWEGAGDGPRAAEHFRDAAERAIRALAFDRAVDLYRRSLALGREGAPEREQSERSLAEALFNAGRGSEAGNAFLALAGARSGREAIELRARSAQSYQLSGHFVEAAGVLRAVVASVGLRFPESRLAVIVMILWNRLLLRLRGLGFEPRDPSRIDPHDLMRAEVCRIVANGLGMADSMKGMVFQAHGTRLALGVGDPVRAARSLSNWALAVSTGGLKAEKHTADVIARARAISPPSNDPYADAYADGADGFAAYMVEKWEKAREYLAAAESRLRNLSGMHFELSTMRMMLARTLAQLGRLTELEQYMGPPLRDAIRRNDLYTLINTRSIVGVTLALAHDDVADALAQSTMASEMLSSANYQLQHVYCFIFTSYVDLYRGEPQAALSRIEAHKARLRKSLLSSVQSVRIMVVDLRARVHLALAEKDPAGRQEHLTSAEREARQLRSEGLPGAAGRASLTDAAIQSMRGDTEGAKRSLRAAIESFEGAAMALYAAAARHALGGLVGGVEGEALIAEAIDCFTKEQVVAPERFIRLYAPGFRSG